MAADSVDLVAEVADAGGRGDTQRRILEGALEAIGRHGIRKLGMQDVSDLAGVSRGTVYRYFATKEELLDAVVSYERWRYERGLARAVHEVPSGAPRVAATIEYAFGYFREHPVGGRLFESEPAFVLSYVRAQLPRLRDSLMHTLEPDLRVSLFVQQGWLTVEQFAELLIRLLLSMFLVPGDDPTIVGSALRRMIDLQYGAATTD